MATPSPKTESPRSLRLSLSQFMKMSTELVLQLWPQEFLLQASQLSHDSGFTCISRVVELLFILEISSLMDPRNVLIFCLLSFVILAVAVGWE